MSFLSFIRRGDNVWAVGTCARIWANGSNAIQLSICKSINASGWCCQAEFTACCPSLAWATPAYLPRLLRWWQRVLHRDGVVGLRRNKIRMGVAWLADALWGRRGVSTEIFLFSKTSISLLDVLVGKLSWGWTSFTKGGVPAFVCSTSVKPRRQDCSGSQELVALFTRILLPSRDNRWRFWRQSRFSRWAVVYSRTTFQTPIASCQSLQSPQSSCR